MTFGQERQRRVDRSMEVSLIYLVAPALHSRLGDLLIHGLEVEGHTEY